MNIYIKSFNRPFYLDRCIRSIKLNVKGGGGIIVLDDGTQSKYVARLKALHPEVEFRSSGADDRKVELLRDENFAAIQAEYPSATAFWRAELSRETNPYFFLIEDDAWVSRRLDLEKLRDCIEANSSVIYKCWWPDSRDSLHRVQKSFRASSGLSVDLYDFVAGKVTDLYAIWIVAFAIYRKDYWLCGFDGVKRMADEHTQLCNVQGFIERHPNVTFAKSARRTVYQGWVVPGRSTPEYYDKGLRQHIYMDALNDAWLANELDVSESFPFDFSDRYMTSVFQGRLSAKAIAIWQDWKSTEIRYQY